MGNISARLAPRTQEQQTELNGLLLEAVQSSRGEIIYNKKTYTVASLLEQGADANAADDNYTALEYAAKAGYLGDVQTLIEHGADVTTNNSFALSLAFQEGHVNVAKILIHNGAEVNSENSFALVETARRGHTKCVRMLIENGADVNTKDRDGNFTALMRAATNNRIGILHILLEGGADVKTKLPSGLTALDIAAMDGHTESVQILIESESELEERNNLHTALMHAINNDHVKTAQTLIKNGADANARFDNGDTALICAVKKDAEELVTTLIENDADVNATSNSGYTALMYAVRRNHEKNTRTLIENNADVNAVANDGQTILEIASSIRNDESLLHKIIFRVAASQSNNGANWEKMVQTQLNLESVQKHLSQPVIRLLASLLPEGDLLNKMDVSHLPEVSVIRNSKQHLAENGFTEPQQNIIITNHLVNVDPSIVDTYLAVILPEGSTQSNFVKSSYQNVSEPLDAEKITALKHFAKDAAKLCEKQGYPRIVRYVRDENGRNKKIIDCANIDDAIWKMVQSPNLFEQVIRNSKVTSINNKSTTNFNTPNSKPNYPSSTNLRDKNKQTSL